MLTYAKNFFNREGVEVNSFRSGSFVANDSYYLALSEAGYKNSSILIKDRKVNIDMTKGMVSEQGAYKAESGITEYPVTSVKVTSIKRKIEILNLSPDFFKLSSVRRYLRKLNYININFHSFSIYLNRLIRENHDNLFRRNVCFLLFENFIERNRYDTLFIGD